MIAGLPVLTGHEFDLLAKVSVIWVATILALVLIALPWVLNWRDAAREARRRDADLTAGAGLVHVPDQERLP